MTLVWVVEDDAKLQANLQLELRERGYAPRPFAAAEEALAALAASEPPPDLLLLDVRLPGMSGVELVRTLSSQGRLPPAVMISGEASIAETVEALKLGVYDFLEKPFRRERLLRSLANALEREALQREVETLKADLNEEPLLLGRSPAIEELRARIARAAPTDGRILILGESGTGKELVAEALHRQSRRFSRPLIKVNCAALPAELIEGELFGHSRGAFTDAKTAKAGLFEEADGGALFLDEIGDMSYPLQARLLRVLEDGKVRRLGETRERQVDVRVIAATHCDLDSAVRAGRFREDLYFRLAHLPLPIPPLRDRPGDVRILFDHFLRHFARRHGTAHPKIAPELYPVLERYSWPGNVRELRNLAERLLVFGGDPLTPAHLPANFFANAPEAETAPPLLSPTLPALPLKEFKLRTEKEYIERILQKNGWNLSATARKLDIQRTHLHQKVKDLGLTRPAGAGEEEEGQGLE